MHPKGFRVLRPPDLHPTVDERIPQPVVVQDRTERVVAVRPRRPRGPFADPQVSAERPTIIVDRARTHLAYNSQGRAEW